MLKPLALITVLGVLGWSAELAVAAEQSQAKDQDRTQKSEQDGGRVYGWQMMTPEERNVYREKMRSMKSVQEREAFRIEHHQQMQQRAKERGVELQDMPMQRGGMGPGMGSGMGAGSGGKNR